MFIIYLLFMCPITLHRCCYKMLFLSHVLVSHVPWCLTELFILCIGQRAWSLKEYSITPKHHTHNFIKYAVKKSRMHMNIEMNNVWLLLLATARSELNRLAFAASFKELKVSIILFLFIISNVWYNCMFYINL